MPDHFGEQARRPPHVGLDHAVDDAGAGHAVEFPFEERAEAVPVARHLDRHDGVGADGLLEGLRGVEGEDLAVVHDRDPVAELVGLLHVVGGEQDGLAVVVELAQDLPEGQPALGVEAGGRFVHEQHGRPVEDRTGHHEALRHAARQGVHRRLGPAAEVELLEQLVGDLPALPGRHAEQPAVEVEVLPHGQGAVEGVLLGHDAFELLGDRRVLHHVDAADQRRPRGRDDPGGEHAGGRGLAGPVGTEQPEDLAGVRPSG